MQKKKAAQRLLWMMKALLAGYIVTGLLLLGLTVLTCKFELQEELVMGGVVSVYVIATFLSGYIMGKLTGRKKYLWGLLSGLFYFLLLTAVSYGVYREISSNGVHLFTTLLLCAGGGMIGGMLA